MSVPKSVIKFDKNGVKFVSSLDRTKYTILELTRAALRDVGKFVCRRCNSNAFKLYRKAGLAINGKMSNRIKGGKSAFQYWVRKNENDLIVGIKHDTWYGVDQELGTSKMKKRAILRTNVERNIATIIEIESQYLSALEDEAKALKLIESELDYAGGATEDEFS